MTIEDLRRALVIPRREVEAAIETLRIQGHPICGGSEGVWLAGTSRELDEYVEARRRRIASVYLGNRALRQTVRRMAAREVGQEQPTIWSAGGRDG